MSREDNRFVRKGHQLLMQRVVQLLCDLFTGEAHRGKKIWAPDITDEQGVAGEHAIGGAVGGLVDDDAHRLWSVARGVAKFENDLAK